VREALGSALSKQIMELEYAWLASDALTNQTEIDRQGAITLRAELRELAAYLQSHEKAISAQVCRQIWFDVWEVLSTCVLDSPDSTLDTLRRVFAVRIAFTVAASPFRQGVIDILHRTFTRDLVATYTRKRRRASLDHSMKRARLA